MKQKSIHLRIILFVVIVSIVNIGLFGLYEHYTLSRSLELKFEETKEYILTRLKSNLRESLWTFDHDSVQSQVMTEIVQNREIAMIYVRGMQSNYILGIVRDTEGKIANFTENDGTLTNNIGIPVKIDIHTPRNDDTSSISGSVVIYFTRSHIDEILVRAVMKRLLEMLVMTILLVLFLIINLRMFFSPLRRLRDSLFDLAHLEGEEINELPEPEEKEFGEVIEGFNQTQRKLKLLIERRINAEKEVLATLQELKQTQVEFIKSAKLAGLGSLVAGISHELNTPIGNGLLALSTLQDNYTSFKKLSPPTKQSFATFMSQLELGLDISMRSFERSALLVRNFKKIAVDQTSEHIRNFDLRELINETLLLLQPTLNKTTHRVEVSVLSDVSLTSYPGALVQVITNLINNALIHAFEDMTNGVISINVIPLDAKLVRIEVSDNGRGISEENLPKIFNPFFSTKLGQGGSGLGLHICHNTVTGLLHGKLEVESNVNTGTVFVLTIPVFITSNK